MSDDIDRTQFIGGSDTAAIIGVSPWKSAFRLYQEKVGAFIDEPTPEKRRIFARGKRWEPVVVEMLVDELQDRGHDVQIAGRNNRYQDAVFPFLAAEVDMDLWVDDDLCNVEIKTVHPFAAKAWGEPGSDEIPIYYAAQAMHGLMITKRRRCIVAALIGADDLRIHQIDRDEETIAGIRAKEIAFWLRVQDRNPPAPETSDDVKWLYSADAGEVAEADDELLRLVGELHYQKQTAKHAEEAIDRVSTQIKLAMGNASLLLYDGRTIATWRSNKPNRKTDWRGVASELCAPVEVIERHTKTVAGNRPLILKV